MDALCIDQCSQEEKGHQVGIMGQIYARSVHVLACVGPHTDDSMFLFRNIDKSHSLLASIHRLTLACTVEDAQNWVMTNPIPKNSWVALRCALAMSARKRQLLAAAFVNFMNRSYVSRVWVLQELHLAPTISLCCGMEIRSFDYLLALSMLVDFWINASSDEYSYTRSYSRTILQLAVPLCQPVWSLNQQEFCPGLQADLRDIQPQLGCLNLASGVKRRRRLAEVLEAMQNFKCADVRDRLFGVLALVEWGHGKPPVPDYGINNYQVAVEVLRIYLSNPDTHPVLGMAVEWPRRLWEIFDVKVEGQAIQEAITKTYGSHRTLDDMQSALAHTHPTRIRGPVCYFDRRMTYMQDTPTRPPDFRGHVRDTWYGVKLHATAKKGTRKSMGRPPYYLCCKEKPPRTSPQSPDFSHFPVKIVDQNGHPFAYAPQETRPNDWLVFSEGGSLSDTDLEMAVVRSADDIHGTYKMIGHAFTHRGCGSNIFPRLYCEYFGSFWDAEDLFVFDWTYIGRPVGAQPRNTTDWLARIDRASREPSFFYGPITHVHRDSMAAKT
jgi:hypothetical protein